MSLPGGGGGNLLNMSLASSKVAGTTTKGSLEPGASLVPLEAKDRGTPPPLTVRTLLLVDPEMVTGSGSSTESGVLGESCGA